MTVRRQVLIWAATAWLVLPAHAQPRNIVVFIADGLRYGSVTAQTAPTMYRIKTQGVDFTNSHALYPTLTTANASAIASGHYLGDTGDYANTLSFGFPIQCRSGTPVSVTFLEDDCVLRAVKSHFADDYMGQVTLAALAHGNGYSTVIVGKKGPAAIQWLSALDSADDNVAGPLGIFVDDATNHAPGIDKMPNPSTVLRGDLGNDILATSGVLAPPSTTTPNLTQQAWFASLTSQELIPSLKSQAKPFVLIYWSRDPDATQHGATDSLGSIVPGINSIDAHAAIYNADSNLKSILDALKLWGLDSNTDIFVTADHGFSTIGKGIPSPNGQLTVSTLAQGFVALDVAKWLGINTLFDPDRENQPIAVSDGQRPVGGSALIGPSPDNPIAIVVANGGTDFIYVSKSAGREETAQRIYANLVKQAYVGALFVNDELLNHVNDFAGALPMSAINLMGSSKLPRPDIIISFRSFVAHGCLLGQELCAVEIADTGLQTGQGMHGTISRADTRNFMAAIGPDFKKGFSDQTPVSNADIAPTLAQIIGASLTGPGSLTGRVIGEALVGGKPVPFHRKVQVSDSTAGGQRMVLEYQEAQGRRYFDAAGVPGRVVGLSAK